MASAAFDWGVVLNVSLVSMVRNFGKSAEYSFLNFIIGFIELLEDDQVHCASRFIN